MMCAAQPSSVRSCDPSSGTLDNPGTPADPLVSMPARRRSPSSHAAGSTRRLGIIVVLILGCLTGRARAATPHLAVSGNLNPDLNGCWEPRAVKVNGKNSWSKGNDILYILVWHMLFS